MLEVERGLAKNCKEDRLGPYERIIAEALQQYGMFLAENGGGSCHLRPQMTIRRKRPAHYATTDSKFRR